MKNMSFVILGLAALTVGAPAHCDEPSLTELEQRCAEARAAKLAPLMEQAVEDCVNAPRSTRTREDCERLNEGFGQGGHTIDGRHRPAMFTDLPECIALIKALDQRRLNRSNR